jgi:transposase
VKNIYGYSGRKIGNALNIPKSTVIDVCAKYSATRSVESIKRSGRPTYVGARSHRKLERIVKVNRRSSLSDITAKFNEENVNSVSKRTVQRHWHNHNFKRRVMKKKVVVKEGNRKKRLSWCRVKRKWTINDCKRVIFSDERKVMIGHDERVHVWRQYGEGWRPDLVPSRDTHPKYDVMIWG